MGTRFKKIKVTADNKINLVYELSNKAGVWDEYSMACSDQPRAEFFTTLRELAAHVIEMCELPADYAGRIDVRGVSFSYGGEKEVMGATISAQMRLMKSNCGLNLNTPHKASESYSDGPADDRQLLTYDCVVALEYLVIEAERYIAGDRAQTVLEFAKSA